MYQGQGHASTGKLGRRPETYFRFSEITQPTAPAAGGSFTRCDFHRKQMLLETPLFLGPLYHKCIQILNTLMLGHDYRCWSPEPQALS